MQCLPDIPTYPFTTTVRLKRGSTSSSDVTRESNPAPYRQNKKRTITNTETKRTEGQTGPQIQTQTHRHMADPGGSPVNQLIQPKLVRHKRENCKTDILFLLIFFFVYIFFLGHDQKTDREKTPLVTDPMVPDAPH